MPLHHFGDGEGAGFVELVQPGNGDLEQVPLDVRGLPLGAAQASTTGISAHRAPTRAATSGRQILHHAQMVAQVEPARVFSWRRPASRRERTSVAITITVNGQPHSLDVEPDMPLLWALRDTLGLTGTKFGCGIAACGACTVHLDGRAVRSCALPVSDGRRQAASRRSKGWPPSGTLHKVQQAWIDAPGAAVRLLPVGHDHGGRRRSSTQHPDADRRGHRRRSSRTSAAAARSRACARAIHAAREAKGPRHEQVDPTRLHRRRHHRRRRLRARCRPASRSRRAAQPRLRRCRGQGAAHHLDHRHARTISSRSWFRTARWDRARRPRWR